MCGIFGVWNFQGVFGADLHRASKLLRHRGPDDEGFVAVDGENVKSFSGRETTAPGLPLLPSDLHCPNALLHRRLSILDLSPKGHQPMASANGKCYITFNGEVYNFKELITTHGLVIDSASDTEVILAMYQKFGPECFEHFRGMWAMAILDLEKGELVLSRDRFGIKPLYICENGNSLAFSSEVKPLLALPGLQAKCPKETILQFLTFGAPTNPHETFFSSISALTPGTCSTWDLISMKSRKHSYYKAGTSSSDKGFAELFNESIREHLIADVEVGSCLSGGLDSSAIVSSAAGRISNFQTFTCTFPGDSIDEAPYARKLADRHSNIVQHFAEPGAEGFLANFDALLELQERPIGSASIFVQYAVMELASNKGIKVLLDGQGADELLGGYYPFAGAYLLGLLRRGKIFTFRSAYRDLQTNFSPSMGKAMLRAGYYSLPESIQIAARKKARIGASLIASKYRADVLRQKGPDRGAANFQTLQRRSLTHGLYELLHYEDRNAMHFGIESRVPFLDHRLVDWALQQKPESLIKEGWTKAPIRDLLAGQGLGDLAWRKDKLGFVAPQKKWKETLQPGLMQRFEAMEIPDIFNRDQLEVFMRKPLHSNEDQTAFWRIFSLLRWLEIFKVKLV